MAAERESSFDCVWRKTNENVQSAPKSHRIGRKINRNRIYPMSILWVKKAHNCTYFVVAVSKTGMSANVIEGANVFWMESTLNRCRFRRCFFPLFHRCTDDQAKGCKNIWIIVWRHRKPFRRSSSEIIPFAYRDADWKRENQMSERNKISTDSNFYEYLFQSRAKRIFLWIYVCKKRYVLAMNNVGLNWNRNAHPFDTRHLRDFQFVFNLYL